MGDSFLKIVLVAVRFSAGQYSRQFPADANGTVSFYGGNERSEPKTIASVLGRQSIIPSATYDRGCGIPSTILRPDGCRRGHRLSVPIWSRRLLVRPSTLRPQPPVRRTDHHAGDRGDGRPPTAKPTPSQPFRQQIRLGNTLASKEEAAAGYSLQHMNLNT